MQCLRSVDGGKKQFYVPVKTGLVWNNWVCIYVYKSKNWGRTWTGRMRTVTNKRWTETPQMPVLQSASGNVSLRNAVGIPPVTVDGCSSRQGIKRERPKTTRIKGST